MNYTKDDWHANRDDGWKDYWRYEIPSYIQDINTSMHCLEIAQSVRAQIDVDVSIEKYFKFYMNGVHITSFFASPQELEELAAGFLLCEGFINSLDQIISIQLRDALIECKIGVDIEKLKQKSLYERIEDLNFISSSVCFKENVIFNAIGQLKELAKSWRRTGGTHSSIICNSKGEILAFSEDVSRACSVDKVVGKVVLSGMDLVDCALVTTGRLSVIIVAKAVRAGFGLIASKAAPLSEGIRLAEEVGITLVAFARKPNLYVYTGAQRVI
jgi:FdhD protein